MQKVRVFRRVELFRGHVHNLSVHDLLGGAIIGNQRAPGRPGKLVGKRVVAGGGFRKPGAVRIKMVDIVQPAQRVGPQHQVQAGVHAERNQQRAVAAAGYGVDIVHFRLHLSESYRVRHGLADVIHAAHQMHTGLRRQAADLHGEFDRQQLNDHIMLRDEFTQFFRVVGVHGDGTDALGFVARHFSRVSRAAVGHGDPGKEAMLQNVVQRPLALQTHAQNQQALVRHDAPVQLCFNDAQPRHAILRNPEKPKKSFLINFLMHSL